MQHHNYTLADIEGMLPWERDLSVTMLIQYLEMEKQKREEKNASKG